MHLRTRPKEAATHPPSEQGSSSFCPRFQFAIELIGRRWVGAILRILVAGPARFNELLNGVPGLSDRLLTERLRELEKLGLVERNVSPERPVRVTYELTASGRSLEDVIHTLGDWAEQWVDITPCEESA